MSESMWLISLSHWQSDASGMWVVWAGRDRDAPQVNTAQVAHSRAYPVRTGNTASLLVTSEPHALPSRPLPVGTRGQQVLPVRL